MASAERPEGKIKDLAYEFDRKRDDETVDRWTGVFNEHSEFFLVYRLPGKDDEKAALRLRYAFKTFDSKTGRQYTPGEIQDLPDEERWLLTTRPLTGDQIQTLLNTAIELHARALEELRASRWWIPIFAAFLAFGGAILGSILAAYLGTKK